MPVTQLGYICFDVADLRGWQTLAGEVLGFEIRETADGGPLHFKLDHRHHRFALYPAARDALVAVGWEVPGPEPFDALVERLREAGVGVEIGSEADCAARRVRALARFRDPSDFPCEIFFGAEVDAQPVQPGRPLDGFKIGALGLGHIVLAAQDRARTVRFYREVLGFRISDTMSMPGLQLSFLRCNRRHHSVAFSDPRPHLKTGVSHVMVELERIEDVGRAYDICLEHLPMRMSLGQHTNDRLLSFYVETPSGFAFEYGYGGLEVDDATWRVEHWNAGSHWGHKKS